jgi:branched-chain amino acid transport system ATP-binding protein
MNVLVCEGLSKAFLGVHALSDVSLSVEEGETLGIIGPNGSGKTTLFNIIAGQVRADRGRVLLAGALVSNRPAHRIAAMGLARTFQNLRLFAGLSAVENVMAGGHLRARTGVVRQLLRPPQLRRDERDSREEALSLLREVGLDGHHDRFPHQLSYGQTKRLELARALNIRPRILLLDEPTAGMNDAQAREILELVGRIKEKWRLTLLVIEHNVPVLARSVDRLLALDAGRRLTLGAPGDVVRDPRVVEAYLGTSAA